MFTDQIQASPKPEVPYSLGKSCLSSVKPFTPPKQKEEFLNLLRRRAELTNKNIESLLL